MDWLLLPPDKAYTLLTDQLITAFEPAQEKWLSQTIHTYKPLWLSWMVIFEAQVGCHDILIFW